MTTQPEPLRLAESISQMDTFTEHQRGEILKAAEKLRRLYEAHDWQYKVAGERLRRIEKLEALNQELLEALQNLYDEQNDAPLERHRVWWEAAMEKARAAIARAEGRA